jgi:hypothetical protein
VLTPKHLGELLGKSGDALAQDRWLRKGIPFVKYGSRVYYLRSDVVAFFTANRHGGDVSMRQGDETVERKSANVSG